MSFTRAVATGSETIVPPPSAFVPSPSRLSYASYESSTPTSLPPPPYEARATGAPEPETLARMLFLYGFFFFPFWIIGSLILVSPLRPTPNWETEKSDVEKQEIVGVLRAIELKWAKRCLVAFLSLSTAVLLLALVIKYGIMAQL